MLLMLFLSTLDAKVIKNIYIYIELTGGPSGTFKASSNHQAWVPGPPFSLSFSKSMIMKLWQNSNKQ